MSGCIRWINLSPTSHLYGLGCTLAMQQEDPGFEDRPGVLLQYVCQPHVGMGSLQVPQSKSMIVRLTGLFKFPSGMGVCLYDCVSLIWHSVIGWWLVMVPGASSWTTSTWIFGGEKICCSWMQWLKHSACLLSFLCFLPLIK